MKNFTNIYPNGNFTADAAEDLEKYFAIIPELAEYYDVIVILPTEEIIYTLNKDVQSLDAETKVLVKQAINTGAPVFGDFYFSKTTQKVFIDVIAPIFNESHESVLILVLRIDPETKLYPIIQSWPTPSLTAETLLVRENDNSVIFLNTLRHNQSPPLSLTIPLTKTDVPAIQAIFGQSGIFDGVDYRGEEVLSDISHIQGTDWHMIAKVDKNEILAESYAIAKYIIIISIFAIILTISLAAYMLNYRQGKLYQELLQAELIKNKAEEETRTTLYSIGDGVITTDAAGMITRMNPIAEQLTGWREKDAIGAPIKNVFHIISELSREEVESPVLRVIQKGIIVGLANHTILIAKDGSEHPITDSGAPIRDKQGHIIGVVLVFRDQTKERAQQKEMALLTDTLSASLNEIYIFDANTLKFHYVNSGALQNLGYTFDEIRHLSPLDLKPDYTLSMFTEMVKPLRNQSKKMLVFETVHKRANGSLYPVEVHLQIFHHENDDVFLAVIQDISEKLIAEEKFQYTEKQYSLLFNEMNEGFALHEIVLDENGKAVDYIFLAVNPAFEKQTGLSREFIVGKKVSEILQQIEPYWIEAYGQVALSGKSTKYENYSEAIDKWFSVSAFCPKINQFATISVDVTNQRKSAQAIVESEERFRSLFENMMQGVIYHNSKGEVTLVNDAAKRILGLSSRQFLGKTSSDPNWQSIHEDGSEFTGQDHPIMVALRTGKKVKNVVMGVYNPIRQEYVWININAVPQFRAGNKTPYQTFVTIEDITDRKNTEATLKQQLDELRRWNNVILGREMRILELKNEINEVLTQSGQPIRYASVKKDNSSDE
ncbi:MAG: PAS domain S-box protein [Anaerolineaceae bacterium]|nr:PAS domain S-box protein [Anaerolineaceae bacterium]